jgi:Cyclic nucleotide-binding domain/Major Facilitator Superfamily
MSRTGTKTSRASRPLLSIVHVLRVVAGNRELRRVELAFVTFNSAEWATWLAVLVYAYAQGGVTESGIVATVTLIPAAALAPVLAAVGERFAPGKALLAAYLAQATTCAAVAAVLFAHERPIFVYFLFAATAVAITATRPTQFGFAPGLARSPEQLTATNVVSGWIESISIFAAPALAGVVLAVSSPGVVFALVSAGCALGAVFVAPLRNAVAAAARADPDGPEPARLGGSLAFVRREPHARTLVLLLAAQGIAIGSLSVLYVELAQGVLHRGGDWAGYFNGAFGAGGVVAVAATARFVRQRRLAVPLVLSVVVWTLTFAGLAALPGLLGAVALITVAGGARATFDVAGRTLLQRVARPDLLSRLFGLLEGLQMTAYAVGSLLAPALVWVGGAHAAFVGVGAVLPLVALAARRRLLGIDRYATVPVVEVALLRSMPIFAPLAPPTLESLARALVPVAAPAGTDVIRQGENGDRFYVIADGEVDIVADGRLVTTHGRGAGVGEIALMYDVPRVATVTARRDTQLYALERDVFLLALTGHTTTRRVAADLAATRLLELRALDAARAAEQATTAGP